MAVRAFPTEKKESRASALKRLLFNWFAPYRRTGGRILFVSSDWTEVHVGIRVTYFTRNYVGTLFGGSMYGALDPVYMMQLITILGKEFIVWDKAATIRFKKPARETVYARFLLTDERIADIRSIVERDKRCNIDLPVILQAADGTVHAELVKTLYVADRTYYKETKGSGKLQKGS